MKTTEQERKNRASHAWKGSRCSRCGVDKGTRWEYRWCTKGKVTGGTPGGKR